MNRKAAKALKSLQIFGAEREVAELVPLRAQLTEDICKLSSGSLALGFELEGTAFEAKTSEQRDIYKESLNTSLRNIATPRLTLYSILTRRLVKPDLIRDYPNSFSKRVGDRYAELQSKSLFQNRLFLVLVYRVTALRAEVVMRKKRDKSLIRELLETGIAELNELAENFAEALGAYLPRRLGIYRIRENTFSELGELYSLLLNHTPSYVPVGPYNLSQGVSTSRILFGRETFEIRHPAASYYGAALGIKEYAPKTYPEMFTGIMEEPYELNFVQSYSFLEKTNAKELFAAQRRRLISAGDVAISQSVALEEAMDQLISNRFVLGEHNTALIVYGTTTDALTKNVAFASATLSDPGNVCVREDIALEGQVFATLPGNTAFRPRKSPITSLNFASMSPFYSFPSGKPNGHHWGEAVTMFRTTVDTPLWFSPHVGDLGHTSIIGMSGSGKTALVAFLLSEFSRLKVRHVILDKDEGLKLLVLSLGGSYNSLKLGTPTGFNPFSLELTPRHASFLSDLISLLVGGNLSAKEAREVEEGVKSVYMLSVENRRLNSLLQFLDRAEPGGIAERLRPWVKEGRYSFVFDNQIDKLKFTSLTAFDITEFLESAELRTPISSYLLYRIEPLIDGSSFALWIDEFWKILDDPYFESFVRDKLKTIRKKDGIVVTSTQSPADALKSGIAAALLEQTPTKIFLPNEYATEADYRDGFKLTPAEWNLLRPLTKGARKFLLKQGSGSALVDFNLSGMDEMLILSGREDKIRLADTFLNEREKGEEIFNWREFIRFLKRRGAESANSKERDK